MSHPAWVCGLKLNTNLTADNSQVTPCVGVWIETKNTNVLKNVEYVTPCVGVWIETLAASPTVCFISSHPAWVCGLKQLFPTVFSGTKSHTLRGCVD